MKNIYQCPICFNDIEKQGGRARCKNDHQYPVVDEHHYFLPLFQEAAWSQDDFLQLKNKLKENNYLDYAELKKARSIIEPYAQIQPFNESFQSLINFLETLKEKLKPGDLILDTWCRTGFSGDFLANFFPEQHVISIWEGDNSVLGYKGFHACFDKEKKATNHTIIFHEPNKPLPFKDNTFAFIYGYDSLHRYTNIIDETFRVAKCDSIICFAHVHLSNSEPEPFFERGGIYRSGEDYFELFSQHSKIADRDVTVHSEVDLYLSNHAQKLKNNMYTTHYNGFIWVANDEFQKVMPMKELLEDESTVIVNPLFEYFDGQLTVATNADAEHVFFRHPILHSSYQSICENTSRINFNFSEGNLLPLSRFKTKYELSNDDIAELQARKLIFVCQMSDGMRLAQAIHMNSTIELN